MKKLILAFVFVLVAASSQAQNYQKDIVGRWKMDIVRYINANHKLVEEQKAYMIDKLEKQFASYSMVFTAKGIVITAAEGEKQTSRYTIQGDSITINDATSKIVKLEKEHFVIMTGGKYMYLKKVK